MIDFASMEEAHALPLYTKRDIILVRGENARVWDREGRCYIDCVAGHGTANLGHCHPAVVEAVRQQAGRLVSCSNTFYNDARALFLERLAGAAPPGLGRAFLCNSGAEAVEAALKLARFTTGRARFVCARQAFHGRTLGALSATHNPLYRDGFAPLLDGFTFVPFNDLQAAEAAVTGETAGVLLEVVQGEGGVHVADGHYLAGVAALCRERGALLLIDEVQTGFCRTGRLFAFERFGLAPDLVCLAKAIAGGLPMGAVLCSSSIQAQPNKHGTTFGGNPLCCAAASASLGVMVETRLWEQAERKGESLMARLRAIRSPRVREVRGLGLMVGIELREKVRPHLDRLAAEGVLALPAGPNVLRLLPPLTIEEDDLYRVAEAVERVLG